VLELRQKLAERLDALGVRIDVPDEDTAVLSDVPTNRRFYNKSATNILIKRKSPGLPFLVCVDEDLKYLGDDRTLSRAFASADRQSGWRALCLTRIGEDFQAAVERTLATLGTDGQDPFLPPRGRREPATKGKTLLAVFGTSLSDIARGRAEPTVGRKEEIDEVTSCLLRWGQARLVVVAGESGVGKSNLLRAVAARLLVCRPEWDLISVDMATLVAGVVFEAEHEGLLTRLLDQAVALPQIVLALEHIELAVSNPRGPLLLAAFLDQGRPLVGTILPDYLPRLQRDCLHRHSHVTELAELRAEQTARVLATLRPKIAEHHRIEIDESCIPACMRAVGSLAGYLPAKAITLLDAAAARSSLGGANVLAPDDIYWMASRLHVT
jgi:ATP-dependent Clp protease ATP-binding subunit ClpA